jgi:serine/threonine protein kinase
VIQTAGVSPDIQIGTMLATYRIESVLGRGGMGVVYLAQDVRLERKVAVKVPPADLAGDESFRKRFTRESRMAAAIDHPNIIPVYDAGEAEGVLYIAMRYVDGTDLRDVLIAGGPLPAHRTLAVLRQVAGALDAAHARGLVHRDVKPGNVMIASGESLEAEDHIYLTDFGLTKRTAAETHITAVGQFVGTIDYVAPEQIEGRDVDGRTDQYSLACVFYECLTGAVPYRRDSEVGVLFAHMSDPPPRISAVRPDLPAGLDDVLGTAMAKTKEERYGSCAEFIAAALRAMEESRAAATGPPKPQAVPAPLPPPPPATPFPPATQQPLERPPDAPPPFAPPLPPAPPGRRRAILGATLAVAIVAAAVVAFLVLRGGGGEGSLQNLAWSRVKSDAAFGGPGDQQMWRTVVNGSRIVGVGLSQSGGQEAAVWSATADASGWSRVQPQDAFRGAGGRAAMSAVVSGGPGLVAAGLSTGTRQDFDAAIWTSADGQTWTPVRDPKVFGGPGDQVMNRVDAGGPGFVAVGFDTSGQQSAAAVWTSSDGSRWQRVTGSQDALAGERLRMRDVTDGGPGLVAVGFSGPPGNSDAAVWTSADGTSWTRLPGSPKVFGGPGSQVMATVVAGGPGLVAVGADDTDAAVWISKDGVTWTKVPAVPGVFGGAGNQFMNFAVSTPKGIVAVGADGKDAAVWVSADGEHWQREGNPVFIGPGEQQVKGITLSGNRLVATGWDGRGGDLDAAVWVAPLPA